MAMRITTWFDVGYADAKAGKECRVPENYAARMGYLRGYEAGQAGDPLLARDLTQCRTR